MWQLWHVFVINELICLITNFNTLIWASFVSFYKKKPTHALQQAQWKTKSKKADEAREMLMMNIIVNYNNNCFQNRVIA